MTTETRKREQSDAGRKKSAARCYIDAQAKAQKAALSLTAAVDRYNDAAVCEEEAREMCVREEVPVGPSPKRLRLTDDAEIERLKSLSEPKP